MTIRYQEATRELVVQLRFGDSRKDDVKALGARFNGDDKGWHLLTRDHQGPVVWADILAFLRDPAAPLPSGAPPIPRRAIKPRAAAAP